MKKIYSFLFMAVAALSANAQVVLTYNGEAVDPSKTLEVEAEEINQYYADYDFWDQRVECGTNDPKILNQGTGAAAVEVTATFENLNVPIQWCFPEQCTYLSKTSETRSASIPGKVSKALQLEPAFTFGQYGTVKCALKIKEGSKSTTYNIEFVYKQPDGIQNLTTGNTNNAIYDLSGRRVAQPQSGNLYIQNGRKFIQK